MKSSVLTAFYTPPQVIDAISVTLRESGLNIDKFLEPSAGVGSFIQSFTENQKANVTAYEKDLLTGKILEQLYPGSKIRISGFEEIPEKQQNSYDVVASNIPFGDTSVFDLSYSRSKDSVKVQAARSVHNYFFSKVLICSVRVVCLFTLPRRAFSTVRAMSRYAGRSCRIII